MPLVRIDLRRGTSDAHREAIGRVVHAALVSIGVPEKDRFQIIAEHAPEGLIYDPSYLNIERTDAIVIVQITFNEGRTTDQKRTLYKGIAEGLHEAIGLRREDVLISLVEVKRENWSFGNGEAQYAT